MTALTLYCYHSVMMWIYDAMASVASRVLRKAGRASNIHEARREIWEVEVRRDHR